MKFPILASVLILIAFIYISIHKQKEMTAKEEADFWERERKANSTRRKSLDGLDYIKIPLDELPLNLLADNEKAAEYVKTIKTLSESPIVNFTGKSNTDLKLEYGAPNITLLTQYDQRYTTLVSTLQKWGKVLYENGEKDAARTVLEFAVSTGTDVSGTYKLLCDIYSSEGNDDAIRELISKAEKITSPMKAAILEYLNSAT